MGVEDLRIKWYLYESNWKSVDDALSSILVVKSVDRMEKCPRAMNRDVYQRRGMRFDRSISHSFAARVVSNRLL